MKTDLTKILAVSGKSGLYRYISQARQGAILESLSTGERGLVSARAKFNALEDISIYTSSGELKLREVFLKLHDTLGDEAAPQRKDEAKKTLELFEKAVPDYDRNRFYLSHMLKIAAWYNELSKYASLDFQDEDKEGEKRGDNE